MNALSRTTLALTLLAPLATAQERLAEPDFTQWTPLDRVMIAVNTDALTENAINKKVARKMSEEKVSTEEDFLRLRNETIQQEVQALLTRQAGEDMGFDQARVQAITRSIYEDEVEQQGGIASMGDALTIAGQTGREKQEEITSTLYEQTWRNSVIGRDAGPGGRPFRDRYIRPSRLCQIYLRMQKTGVNIEFLERRGARPGQVELQALLLEARHFGSLEKAEERARKVRQGLELGALQWDEVIDELGSLENRGVLGPRPMRFIQGILDPGNGALVEFVLDRKENSYSVPMPFAPPNPQTGERRVRGIVIYRFLGSESAVLPGFTDQGVQKDLTFWLLRRHDEQLIGEGLMKLNDEAYVWFIGIEEQKKHLAEAEAEEQRKVLEARERNAEEERAKKEGEKPAEEGAVEEDPGPPEPPGGGS